MDGSILDGTDWRRRISGRVGRPLLGHLQTPEEVARLARRALVCGESKEAALLQVEIRVKGQIDENWSEWFAGLEIMHTDQDETILTGDVVDQAALYGLLARLRDLGLPLILATSAEVNRGQDMSGKEEDRK